MLPWIMLTNDAPTKTTKGKFSLQVTMRAGVGKDEYSGSDAATRFDHDGGQRQ